jgi:hypothetical protein
MLPAVLLLFSAALQAASAPNEAERLFEHGITFAQFVRQARAQRETWLRNAARTEVPADAVDRLRRAGAGLRVLIVAEDWCADSVHTVPYIVNLADAAGVKTRLVDRAAGAAIMAAHPARDGRPVTPVVVLLRDNRDVGAWVERPLPLQDLFLGMANDPDRARRFADRAKWYEADRGRTTIAEFVALAEQTTAR